MAFTLGESDHSPSSSVPRRAKSTVITRIAMKKMTSTASRISRSTLPWNRRWKMPRQMPAISVTHSDRIRAINATNKTRNSKPGPRLAVPASAALTRNGANRMSVTPASAPPMVHTMVDTRRTLMPNSRPVSALSAEARMANPNRVRPKNNARTAITSGTMITTMSSRPPMRR